MKLNRTRFPAALSALLRLDRRILVILLVALIFLVMGTAATHSASPHLQATTVTPLPAEITPDLAVTPSPFPPELLENGNQTIGLTIAASILVLIVGVGVFNTLRHWGPGDR
jgi:hypothetical protein